MKMKPRRVVEDAAENTNNGEDNAVRKPLYTVERIGNAGSLVFRFRLLKPPESNDAQAPDSTEDNQNGRIILKLQNPSTSKAKGSSNANARPSSEKTISQNIYAHKPSCPYSHWWQASNNLLTDDELRMELTANYFNQILAEGRFPSVRTALEEAQNRSAQQVANGPIRDYLDQQRNFFQSMKEVELSRCKCPAAQLHLQDQAVSSTGLKVSPLRIQLNDDSSSQQHYPSTSTGSSVSRKRRSESKIAPYKNRKFVAVAADNAENATSDSEECDGNE